MFTPKKMRQFRNYKNLGGATTVTKYEIAKDAMTIRFSDGTAYRWTNQSAGPENISKMKVLAQAGKGLGTFVEKTVKETYIKKIR